MVQETYPRYKATPAEHIQMPRAFLSTVITRLCLDQLKSARVQRETYLGPWLPEPLVTEGLPTQHLNQLESLSMAFLVVLESLSPLERAVFLLREVFDYEYAEIAQIISRDEAACRQLFSRAKKHVVAHRPRFEASSEAHRELLTRFIAACQSGDLNALTGLLAQDVTSWSDGGGKSQAATRPVQGRDSVARYFIGLSKKMPPATTFDLVTLNGHPGLLMRIAGRVFLTITLEINAGVIQGVRLVVNPDKLAHLNPEQH